MKRKNKFECLRCGNEWNSALDRPKQCPACKQPAWDRPARVRPAVKAMAVKNVQDQIFDEIGKAGKV